MGREHHPVTGTRPHEAQPPLALVQFAQTWANVALDAAVGEPVPVTRRKMRTFEFLFHTKRSCSDGEGHTIEHARFAKFWEYRVGAPALLAIRTAAVAGLFYPAAAAELRGEIAELLGGTETVAAAPVPKVLISPHAGYIYSGRVAAAGYRRLAPARERITRVVLLGPSHVVGFHGLAAASADGWQTPLGSVPVDRPLVVRLIEAKLIEVLDAAHAREHSLEVHLPFLQSALGGFALVPIVTGEASPQAVAAVLDAVWGGPETLIVVSTDFSHYLDYRTCQETDLQTAEAIERLDPDALGPESACGRVPVRGLLAVAKRRGMGIARLDLRNSRDTAGPRQRVVGYGSWALFEPEEGG
jgi:AmmeMemoRadiSam system protein B